MTDYTKPEWMLVKKKKKRNRQKPKNYTIFIDDILMKKIQSWQPNNLFNATPLEIDYIREIGITEKWNKTTFHEYFKSIEAHLLIQFRNYVNKHNGAQTYILDSVHDDWFIENLIKWKILALLRDFHDHMCDRDQKHYIRTDDCRRFMPCVISGFESGIFARPVHRLLKGDTAPYKFTHPLFTQFS